MTVRELYVQSPDMTKAEWRASRRIDLRASEAQIRAWARAAAERGMTLSGWMRLVLDEATTQKKRKT